MSDRLLTDSEKLVLVRIVEFFNKNKYPPSCRELCAATGYNSPSTVHTKLKALEQKGYIAMQKGAFRTIRVLKGYRYKGKKDGADNE